jgi:hypothetical protein
MNQTNETAETPTQWAQRIASDAHAYYEMDARERIPFAELSRVKAQADRADAMEAAIKWVTTSMAYAAPEQMREKAEEWHQRLNDALSQTGGPK